ncbi:MAG: hypothetical protein R3A48_15830 [Polyangiales bacterium]
MRHTEEQTFDLRLVFRCEFDDDYEGDRDGYAWAAELPAVRQAVLRAALDALTASGAWAVRGASRGRAPDDEAVLVLTREYRAGEDSAPGGARARG